MSAHNPGAKAGGPTSRRCRCPSNTAAPGLARGDEGDPQWIGIWTARTVAAEAEGASMAGPVAAELVERRHPSTALKSLQRVQRLPIAGVATPTAVVAALRAARGLGDRAAALILQPVRPVIRR